MQITYHPLFTDNFKFNSYTLNFLMPLNERNATCCALLSQILKRGCEKYGEMDQITARLEELYGATVSISSDKLGDRLSFTVQTYFLDDRFAMEGEEICKGVMDLAGDLLRHPMTENGVFRSDFFEQEKRNHADQIAGLINDKRLYALIRCKEIMFEDSDYKFTSVGTLSCLEQLTPEKLYLFYQELLATAEVVVTYIGRKLDLAALTQTHFDLQDRPEQPCSDFLRITPAEPKYIAEEFDVAQGKLTMGFRLISATEYYATRLFNVIYGGSPTSKLFNNVRERLSLCYYCSSAIDFIVHSMFISSGIEFANYEIAKNEILAQLEDMKNGVISDEEFENGKLYLLDQIAGIRDSHSALLSETLRNHLLGIDDTVEEQLKRIAALTKDDVIAVAKAVALDTVYFLKGKEQA